MNECINNGITLFLEASFLLLFVSKIRETNTKEDRLSELHQLSSLYTGHRKFILSILYSFTQRQFIEHLLWSSHSISSFQGKADIKHVNMWPR